MRALFLSVVVAAVVLICSAEAFAGNNSGSQTGTNASSKQSATPIQTPAPKKTNTGKTSKNQSYQKGKDRHGGHGSHTDVGIGVNVDLGGVGQRRPEADPFAVPAGPPPVAARTEQKLKAPKKKQEVATSNPFSHVELTGPQAKGESNP